MSFDDLLASSESSILAAFLFELEEEPFVSLVGQYVACATGKGGSICDLPKLLTPDALRVEDGIIWSVGEKLTLESMRLFIRNGAHSTRESNILNSFGKALKCHIPECSTRTRKSAWIRAIEELSQPVTA